jgi:hypothetical protein
LHFPAQSFLSERYSHLAEAKDCKVFREVLAKLALSANPVRPELRALLELVNWLGR